MRPFCVTVVLTLAIPLMLNSAVASNCGAIRSINGHIQTLNSKVQNLNAQSGGRDTPEMCHLTFQLARYSDEMKSILASDPKHCKLFDAKFQWLESINFDSSIASCGANWR